MSRGPLPEDLTQALADLSAWFDEGQIPYTLIGGVAVSLVAQPRVTQDIDAVIWVLPEGWTELVERGARFGYQPRITDPVGFAQKARVLLLFHASSGIRADLSCGALAFEQEAIARASTLRFGALSLKVSTPEDLLIMKAVAGRPRDIADIESILNAHPQLDAQRVRGRVQEFAQALGRPDLYEQLEKQFTYQRDKSAGSNSRG